MKRFDALDEALDEVSYEWLSDEHPLLVQAIRVELEAGRSAREIRLHVQAQTDRRELALRCEQTARHLARA